MIKTSYIILVEQKLCIRLITRKKIIKNISTFFFIDIPILYMYYYWYIL